MPALNGETVHFSKPPVTYWVIAGAIAAFAHSAWAVRTLYACSLGPFVAANVVSTDVLLSLFEALAMYGYIAAQHAYTRSRARRHLWIMWLGFALAFETKGPPGLLPLLAIVVYTPLREGRRRLAALFTPTGLATFFVVAFGWYLVVVIRRPDLLCYFLRYEVYDRVFTPAQHRHPQWYGWAVVYGPVFLFGTLPWWPALIRGLRPFLSWRHWRAVYRRHPGRLFLLVWLLLPLLIFCIARSRLPMYVLPLFMPLTLMLSLKLTGWVDLSRTGQRVLLAA